MAETVANVEMAAAWDGDEGDDWARDWERYDRGVRGHHRALLDAAAIDVSDRVLDIGCGNGQTTCDAARAGATAPPSASTCRRACSNVLANGHAPKA